MNLLSLVGPRLDNIYPIRRKWYYSLGLKYLQSKCDLETRGQTPVGERATSPVNSQLLISIEHLKAQGKSLSPTLFMYVYCTRVSMKEIVMRTQKRTQKIKISSFPIKKFSNKLKPL
jgi:hypothetical protein